MNNEENFFTISFKIIFSLVSLTILIVSLINLVLYFPYRYHLSESETKYINNMVMYIEKIQKSEKRLPSRNEMRLWIRQQDSQGMRYDGRGFDFIPFGGNNYSIVFWAGNQYIKYSSTTTYKNIKVEPQKKYMNFVVLLALSFMGVLFSVLPAKLKKNG